MSNILTDDEKDAIKKRVSSFSPKNDRMAWKRRHEMMQTHIEDLRVVEDKILQIIKDEKYPIMDKITELRTRMLKDCIHPYDQLVVSDSGVVTCKFCETKLRVKNVKRTKANRQ